MQCVTDGKPEPSLLLPMQCVTDEDRQAAEGPQRFQDTWWSLTVEQAFSRAPKARCSKRDSQTKCEQSRRHGDGGGR